MTKALAKQETLEQKALALKEEANERAAALQELGVEAADLVIPSIQVMQNTSGLVGDGKAKLGDIVNMATEEVLGSPVGILPLKLYKTLRVYSVGGGFKFLREEPLTAANDKLQGEGVEEIEGVKTPVKRFHTLNFFVLLKTDLDKGEGFPCLLRFKSTGMNAGRSLATHLYKQVFFRKKPYSSFVMLSTKKEKKDTNTYAVPSLDTKGPNASPEEVQAAESWLAMLAAGNYKVDDREEQPENERAASATPVVVGSDTAAEFGGEY